MSSIVEDPAIPLIGMPSTRQSQYLATNNNKHDNRHSSKHVAKVGSRLACRKDLFLQRKRLCEASLLLAVAGIALMMLENELVVHNVIARSEADSIVLKLAVTATTVGCLATLMWYHVVDVRLFIVNNSMADWRLAVTPGRVASVCVELAVCAVHPIPGEYYVSWMTTDSDNHLTAQKVMVPLDVVLSLPMFLRLYLLLRYITLHSRLFASSPSIGVLNRVRFNFRFIFKSIMALHPGYALSLFMLSFFLLASWSLRLCEVYNDATHARVHGDFLNSMWVVASTFLTIGYGDIVPNSVCGRGVAVMSGVMGAGCTALVVAVLARKLELSSAERHVHDFVLEAHIGKRLKNKAANVIKRAWRLFKLNKEAAAKEVERGLIRTLDCRMLKEQSRLQRAIHGMREVRTEKRRLRGSAMPMLDVLRVQTEIATQLGEVRTRQQGLEDKVGRLEDTMLRVYDKLCFVSGDSGHGCRC
ncbi:small conductance calcium-activated potassium channel protein-like [Littorina saxatilis]|uniref:small conductance calcium-activated potassium channel protein-like n=1 Tax=Littorina saxatilis TaxID=31220 RepID=UPI0038B43CFD